MAGRPPEGRRRRDGGGCRCDGAEHPDAFLETFADAEFETNVEVLVGLGQVAHLEATRRLLAAADAADRWVRMYAIIGLGGRHDAAAEAALIRAIGDAEYFVRYHALRGLAATGTAEALRPLSDFHGESAYERELARAAIQRIEARASA